jgi:hypothetical protein
MRDAGCEIRDAGCEMREAARPGGPRGMKPGVKRSETPGHATQFIEQAPGRGDGTPAVPPYFPSPRETGFRLLSGTIPEFAALTPGSIPSRLRRWRGDTRCGMRDTGYGMRDSLYPESRIPNPESRISHPASRVDLVSRIPYPVSRNVRSMDGARRRAGIRPGRRG